MISYETFIAVNVLYITSFTVYRMVQKCRARKILIKSEQKFIELLGNKNGLSIQNAKQKLVICSLKKSMVAEEKYLELQKQHNNKEIAIEELINKCYLLSNENKEQIEYERAGLEQQINNLKQNKVDLEIEIFNYKINEEKLEKLNQILGSECQERKIQILKLRKKSNNNLEKIEYERAGLEQQINKLKQENYNLKINEEKIEQQINNLKQDKVEIEVDNYNMKIKQEKLENLNQILESECQERKIENMKLRKR